MFFSDREKSIYDALDGTKHDPLRVLHLLTIHTGNRLSELVALRNPETLATGDVSGPGRAEAEVAAARSELELSDAARKAFGLPMFHDSGLTDATVLETLYHFFDWLEGKGPQAPTPRSSDASVLGASEYEPTTSSWR